jgi:hypothetical protein
MPDYAKGVGGPLQWKLAHETEDSFDPIKVLLDLPQRYSPGTSGGSSEFGNGWKLEPFDVPKLHGPECIAIEPSPR